MIELSIVVLIVSVVASSSLSFIGKRTQAAKNISTKEKLVHISKALKVYANSNGKLPCPARYDKNINSNVFGVGIESDETCTSQSGISNQTNTNVIAGSVPVLTLGLPPYYMFDEWGMRISYIVDADMVQRSKFLSSSHLPNIRVVKRDENGEYIDALSRNPKATEINSTITDCRDATGSTTIEPDGALETDIPVCAAYVLLSHGTNGHGARLPKGGAWKSANVKGVDELKNRVYSVDGESETAIFDNIFFDMPLNTENLSDPAGGSGNNYFDDILVYSSKGQLRSN